MVYNVNVLLFELRIIIFCYVLWYFGYVNMYSLIFFEDWLLTGDLMVVFLWERV